MPTAPIREALRAAAALLLPASCAGCDAPDLTLCSACETALHPSPRRQVLRSGLVVHSAVAFEAVPARVIRALKEDGRTALARPLGAALAGAWAAGAAEWGDDARAVPVPSSRAALRRRGYAPVQLVSRRAGLSAVTPLRQIGSVRDQRGLAREERAGNVAGSMAARGRADGPVVLVDDVLTTGATLQEATRALTAAGWRVLGAVTVAATPLRWAGAAAHGERID